MKKILLLALFFIWTGTGFAQTAALRYTGQQTLYKDTVWHGEVLIDGILTVAPGVTLKIRPGTVVRFTRYDSNGDGIGEHEIFIQGTLRAVGTAAAPIRFTSAAAHPGPGDWGALNMMVSETDNVLEHCIVEYGYRGFHAHFAKGRLADTVFRHNMRAVQFQESTVSLRNCRIENNRNGMQFRNSKVTLTDCTIRGNYWGLRCVYSTVHMQRCRIADNLINGANLRVSTVDLRGNRIVGNRKGIYLQRCKGTLADNVIVDNSENGIFLEGCKCLVRGNRIAGNGRAGIKWLDSTGRLRRNLLAGNGEFALVDDGAGAVDARGNWWGTTVPAAIAALIRDGRDQSGLGQVDARRPLSVPPVR